MAGSAKD
jgi:hypothetical protein